MFMLITIMLYWMTISFNLARAAEPLLRKIPFFASHSVNSYRAPRQDPFNIAMARKTAQAVPRLRSIVRLTNHYHEAISLLHSSDAK